MQPKQLADGVWVSPQIAPMDLTALSGNGFKSIICNRPDREQPDQPEFAEIAGAASELGMQAVHIPIVPGVLGQDDIAAFEQALVDLPKPILAYCRSGARSATLWALSKADDLSPADILASTANAGYDLSGLAGRLESG